MLKYGLIAAVVVAILLASAGVFLAQKAPESNPAAARLAVAVRQARRRLPDFRKRMESPRVTDRSFFLRAELLDKAGKAEYLWLKDVKLTATGFLGTLDETPALRADLHRGEEITVKEAEVVDWTIRHTDGTLEGAFTQGLEITAR
jgi:uncharacterized protein YegJ (DUF2314 family)